MHAPTKHFPPKKVRQQEKMRRQVWQHASASNPRITASLLSLSLQLHQVGRKQYEVLGIQLVSKSSKEGGDSIGYISEYMHTFSRLLRLLSPTLII